MCDDGKNLSIDNTEVKRMDVWEYLEWKMGERNEENR